MQNFETIRNVKDFLDKHKRPFRTENEKYFLQICYSPPPFLKHRYGNLQTFPRPTAKPTHDRMKSSLLLHCSRSGVVSEDAPEGVEPSTLWPSSCGDSEPFFLLLDSFSSPSFPSSLRRILSSIGRAENREHQVYHREHADKSTDSLICWRRL